MQEENKNLHLQKNPPALETQSTNNQISKEKPNLPHTRYANTNFEKLSGSLRQNLLRRKQASQVKHINEGEDNN